MRLRAAAFAALASVSVLAAGWEMGVGALSPDQATSAPTASTPTVPGTPGSTNVTVTAPAQPAASGAPSAAATAPSGTFTGSVVQTRFGNMQVAVTIADGVITDVTALQLTDHDGKSVNISNRAAPILRAEVLSAQSATVHNVGGATYTTRGYLQSLQSALDAARF